MPDSPPSPSSPSSPSSPEAGGPGDSTGNVPPAPDRTSTGTEEPGAQSTTPLTDQPGETAPDLTRRDDDADTSASRRRTPIPSEVAVRARGLTHIYDDRHGLHDVDLDVPTGQILGIVGPSGSGKTTLARLMLGLLEAHEGSIEVLGVDPAKAERHHHTRIGYLPQGNALDPDLSIRHNLDFMASLQGLPWRAKWWPGKGSSAARQRIDDVLELVGLEAEESTLLRRASGGEQRRVALAAAIVHDPELLILDEPTAGIDPVLRAQLWEYLTRLRDQGHTLVITTQYVTEADECDLVALMVDGRIIRVDDPDGLRREAYGGHMLEVEHDSIDPMEVDLRTVEGVVGVQRRMGPRRVRFLVNNGNDLQARISDRFTERGAEPPLVSVHRPSFDEVFVRLVEEHRRNQDDDRLAAGMSRA